VGGQRRTAAAVPGGVQASSGDEAARVLVVSAVGGRRHGPGQVGGRGDRRRGRSRAITTARLLRLGLQRGCRRRRLGGARTTTADDAGDDDDDNECTDE